MNELKVKESDILSGVIPEYELQRQMKILLCAACVNHGVLCILLGVFSLMYPALYQLASVIFYSILAVIAHPMYFAVLYVLTVVEVCAHALLMTALVGGGCAFSLYVFLVIPVGVYISYTQYSDRTKIWLVVAGSVAALAAFFFALYMELRRERAVVGAVCVPLLICNVCAVWIFLINMTVLFIKQVQTGYLHWETVTRSLIKEANTDPLTGLLNRRGMQVILSQRYAYWRKNRIPFSLVMGDIDNFKSVNDTYGHDFGDRTLVHISSLIASMLRSSDVACRWGGEEFLILIVGDPSNTRIIAERIRQGIEISPVCAGSTELYVTMTFGVASSESGADLDGIIRMADQNLYFGKEQGKNCVI